MINKLVPSVELHVTAFEWTLKPSDSFMAADMVSPVSEGNYFLRAVRALERLLTRVRSGVVAEVSLVL